MLHTTIISVGKKKQPDLYDYMTDVTANTKNLRNVATFYQRNLYTGLGKTEDQRHPLENDVIQKVCSGLTKHNLRALKDRETYLQSKDYIALPEEDKEAAYKKFCKKHAIFRLPDEKHRSLSKEAMITVLQEIDER